MQFVTAADQVGTRLRPRWSLTALARVGTPAAFGLAALSGLLYAAGFPPLAWPAAAWVALIPLFMAAAALPPLRAAAAGMIWAVTMGIGVAWWLPGMFSGYFGLSPVVSWVGALMVIVTLSGVYVSA